MELPSVEQRGSLRPAPGIKAGLREPVRGGFGVSMEGFEGGSTVHLGGEWGER